MAEMVWCQSCKTVVWAYDHQPSVDLRGICNMLQLPCPKCGEIGNFNGWADRLPYDELKQNILTHSPEAKIHDFWSIMHYIADHEGVEWDPSGDNRWFPKPRNTQISDLIKHKVTLNLEERR